MIPVKSYQQGWFAGTLVDARVSVQYFAIDGNLFPLVAMGQGSSVRGYLRR